MSEPTRRNVLTAVAGVSAAAVLGACAGDDDAGPGAGAGSPSEPADAVVDVLARTTDIPLNGGTVFVDKGVVVTQPASGEFRAFSSLCTHKGCALTNVENGAINCRCHGARFSLADGAVQGGPATRPLDPRTIKVDRDNISLA
jgi:Rieske Fe-S protein